jgi:putative SOS response-associated peptidase YedK
MSYPEEFTWVPHVQPLQHDQEPGRHSARLFRVHHDRTGNMPPLPGIFSDYMAPIVRNVPDGRELVMARWGMPGPPQFGGAPITNIRNTKSPHWRAWLQVGHRCVVPFTSFSEIRRHQAAEDADVACTERGSTARILCRHLDCMAR